ncbi:phasin family protein [Lysobacter yangpyeongensis]|uniref:Phasin family protein n=1 Tax=Lysobacter yangpyeongensis TaxID=346182 RepID=A0ABW0SKJ7_9GAMM
MAKFKKTAKKTTRSSASTRGTSARSASTKSRTPQAEQLSKTLSETAQQVWLAGVGAFGRAQTEGTKLFEALIKEGLKLEKNALRFAGGQADAMRGAVENKVGQARERATDTWDRLEKVFEDRVQRALTKLGVPGRDDLAELTRKVDTLTAELRKSGKPAATTRAAKKTAARKTRSTPAA